MNYNDDHVAAPTFHNVAVTVTPGLEPNTYTVTSKPDQVKVHSRTAVINFQIVSAPPGVAFAGMRTRPDHFDEFSVPSLSYDRQMITFSDFNNDPQTINVDLILVGPDGDPFVHDPQILNEPR